MSNGPEQRAPQTPSEVTSHTVCTGQLAIEHLINDDGTRSFTVEVSDDMSYVEALGLLEAAKLHIAQQYDDGEDDA